jgi:signal transduction histidine kinase
VHNEHVDGHSMTWEWRRPWRMPAWSPPDLTSRAIVADLALVAVATVAGLAVAVYAARSPVPPHVAVPAVVGNAARAALHHGGWWRLTLLAIAARMIPLAGRRLFPLVALWLCLGACALIRVQGADAINFIALVPAGYSAVAHSRHRGATVITAAVALFVLAFPRQGQPSNYTLLLAFLVLIPALLVGNVSQQWRRRLEHANAEHEAATRRALERERARLASELHDVVTHNVSVMIVQAGAARQVLADAPDDARAALLSVEASGRAAMTELRHLLGLLSPADEGAPAGPGDADGTGVRNTGVRNTGVRNTGVRNTGVRNTWVRNTGSCNTGSCNTGSCNTGSCNTGTCNTEDRCDLRPQPGLGQLRALVDRVSAAGLDVDLQVDELPGDLPPGVDLAAFRVVQEALTNVIKHAGGPRTSVRVGYRDGDVAVEVADAGAAGPVAAPVRGAGRGLAGLRERAELYGGELEAGPRPGGGWRVRARIPAGLLPAAADR